MAPANANAEDSGSLSNPPGFSTNQAMLFVGGIGAGAIGGGFFLGKTIGNRLGRSQDKMSQPLPSSSARPTPLVALCSDLPWISAEDLKADGARLASRALMAGTALCATWGVMSVFAIRYAMGVSTVRHDRHSPSRQPSPFFSIRSKSSATK